MEIVIANRNENDWRVTEGWQCVDNGTPVSGAGISTVESWLGKGFVCTNTVGGVSTPPEYRRRGYVRAIFDEMYRKAPEYGWAVSLLHPFSFGYYRNFGYERVADHRILTFPMRALEFIPRCKDFEPLGDRAEEAMNLYNSWAAGRNVTFRRGGSLFAHDCFGDRGASVFVVKENDEIVGYVALRVENHLVINHMEGDYLHVYEMVYKSPSALLKLMGVLRAFDGQNEMVKIHNCAMAPEVELTLRHYTHTQIQVLPDIMARPMDMAAIFNQNVWPKEAGHFVIRVDDKLPLVNGTWEVEYANGECEVKRADGKSPCAVFTPAAIMPMIYGFEAYTEELLRYADGISVEGDVSDLIRAFPKRNCGLFEHF